MYKLNNYLITFAIAAAACGPSPRDPSAGSAVSASGTQSLESTAGIRETSGERTCTPGYFTAAVLSQEYLLGALPGRVVLWLADTGESARPNPNYSYEIFEINVKRAEPTYMAPVFHRLGNGWGPIDTATSSDFGCRSMDEVSLLLDANGDPTVAWTYYAGLGARRIRARQWTGQDWNNLGDFIYTGPGPSRNQAHRPRLSWDANLTLRVTWEDVDPETGEPTILTRIWNGKNWQ